MLCEKCGKNQATIKAKIIANGLVSEKNYCAQCWEEESEQSAVHFSFSDLLKGFLQQPAQAPAQSVTCSECGMDLRTFRHGGLLGCSKCYESFEQALEPMLKKIHGAALHKGKASRCGEENAEQQSELDSLKSKLAEAVKNEEYESAVIFRDRIKELTKEGPM